LGFFGSSRLGGVNDLAALWIDLRDHGFPEFGSVLEQDGSDIDVIMLENLWEQLAVFGRATGRDPLREELHGPPFSP
jgi:hypothetical protein